MYLNKREYKVLKGLGFHPSGDRERGWTRRFGRGPVTAVLFIRKSSLGFEYRVTPSNPEQHADDVQWFDAVHLGRLRPALRKADRVWKKARRGLEGGLARRTMRRLLNV